MNKARNRSSAKERIIKAYLRLLTQGKHRKVTVSAVAKAAECNRDTFYYYFASIDALAKCAFDESFSIIARTFGKSALSYAKERSFSLFY